MLLYEASLGSQLYANDLASLVSSDELVFRIVFVSLVKFKPYTAYVLSGFS